MTLAVDIRRRLGAFQLDVSFQTSGRLVALFGPSGSGKTSVVNLIAGLLRPDEGHITVDGRVLTDTATKHIRAPAQAAHRLRVSGCPVVSAHDG